MNVKKLSLFMFCLFWFSSCSSLASKRTIASNELVETWKLVNVEKFSFIDSVLRGQGLVSDNNGNIYFSSNHSIIKTNSKNLDKADVTNLFPFKDLKKLGINHVGDIDFSENKIIAPMEDGGTYKNPVIAFFEASKLSFIGYVNLPLELQPDGVPWTCAIPEKNILLSSRYNNVSEFNVYNLNSANLQNHSIDFVETIKLPEIINRIQGVKYFNDAFYITSNSKSNNGFPILKFSIQTNKISTVAFLPEEVTEIEGLTFVKDENSTVEMFVLGIIDYKLKRRIKVYKFQMN
jgi:hypothetical protein